MSMCCELVMLRDATIERLLRSPSLVWRVIAPDDADASPRSTEAGAKRSWLSRLLGRARPPAAADLTLVPPEGQVLGLDKAWHGIHYLLTGTAWEGSPPLAFLVADGRDIGDIDVGFGPARAFAAAEARAIRDALAALDDATLRARFDPADMMRKEIYPEIWDRDPADDDTLGYLMQFVPELRAFLGTAVADGSGFAIWLS